MHIPIAIAAPANDRAVARVVPAESRVEHDIVTAAGRPYAELIVACITPRGLLELFILFFGHFLHPFFIIGRAVIRRPPLLIIHHRRQAYRNYAIQAMQAFSCLYGTSESARHTYDLYRPLDY